MTKQEIVNAIVALSGCIIKDQFGHVDTPFNKDICAKILELTAKL